MSDERPQYTTEEIEELRTLVERMARSKVFEGKRERFRLLEYLFKKSLNQETVGDYDIVVEHLGVKEPQESDAAKVRQLCGNLRKSLIEFGERDVYQGHWRFFLPLAKGLGYKLSIVNLHSERGWVGRFWDAHVETRRPAIFVYDEPLFYRDEFAGTVVRMAQFETEDEAHARTAEQIVQALRPEAILQPCHLYTLGNRLAVAV